MTETERIVLTFIVLLAVANIWLVSVRYLFNMTVEPWWARRLAKREQEETYRMIVEKAKPDGDQP